MTDPDVPDFSELDESDDHQAATDAVKEVVSWYNAQILAERRSPGAGEERLEELKAAREAALLDGARLATADPQEAGRIAALYAARLKELTRP
ncbi:hypothetical protein ACWGCP_37955 [Streptomyces niveus]